jgi:signal transduction histidine kinase/CheY-like chemotaxis protein
MGVYGPGHESELRISAKWVIGILMLLGIAVILGIHPTASPSDQLKAMFVGLSIQAVSAIIWRLDSWNPRVSRWLTVIAVVVLVYLGNSQLDVPGFLTLMAIPTALAAALLDLPAATVVGAGQTVLVLLSPRPVASGPSIAIAVVAVWAMLGVMAAVYRPVQPVVQWAWEYSQEAQGLLQEARDRKEELARTLDGLANANRQLALANERMASLRMIAEEAQRAKAAFVANVSHEFRTPLNMIIGLVDLMAETPEFYDVVLSPKMREDLEVVHRNCEHLSNMVNDVLDLTRTEAGRLALYSEQVDLKGIVDRSVAAVRPLLENKRLTLQVTIPDDLPTVYCDRTRIQQVILNLLSNAARFTEEGGITIEVVREDQRVLVSVRDTGPGISPEDAERIFEPFWQGGGGPSRHKGGSGLGLSISRQFVRLHGGRMWVESELGIGTTFFFTLPISPPVGHAARPGGSIREDWLWREQAFRTDRAAHTDQLVKPRVVICDETGTLYHQFARYSGEAEFVDTRDLAQAGRELEGFPARAVVLNITAPADFPPLVEAIRRQAPGTPVMGCSVPEQAERAIDAGALGHLIKPVTRTDLEDAIQAVGKPVRRVLVVDDDPDVLQLFSRMLHVCDNTLRVLTASSGKEALDKLRRTPPDLMLLDIVMPDMDGKQVLESMVQDEGIENVPTFFVSAQDPADQPPVSDFLITAMDGGLSLSKLLRCSMAISALLLEPEEGPDLAPV